MTETRNSDYFFFHYLIQPFQDNSVNIYGWRFCKSFIISYSYSQAGLTDLKLCWVEAIGMKWYEFLLCSCPSLTHSWGSFPLRKEEPWHSQEQRPRGSQDRHSSWWLSGAPCNSQPGLWSVLAGLSSWGRTHTGMANPAPGCSDGSHRANWSISACHCWLLLTVVTSLDEPVLIVYTSQTAGSEKDWMKPLEKYNQTLNNTHWVVTDVTRPVKCSWGFALACSSFWTRIRLSSPAVFFLYHENVSHSLKRSG